MSGKKGQLGTSTSIIQTDRQKKKQRRDRLKRQQKLWQSKNGPVVISQQKKIEHNFPAENPAE